ncbi:hypothetical protein CCP4SC76_1540002 [Gammaproteobacteria bacterium]
MQFIHDHRDKIREESLRLGAYRDQQQFDGFRRGQENVRRIGQYAPFVTFLDITVPESHPTSQISGVVCQAMKKVIEQGLDGTDIEDAEPLAMVIQHLGQQRKDRRLSLAAGGRGETQDILAIQNWANAVLLQWAKVVPAQAVDDVLLNRRV